MNPDNRGKISSVFNAALNDGAVSIPFCSEDHFLAADHLRAALKDLTAVHERLQQFLILAKRESATSTKES